MTWIALDAMGGDFAPRTPVEAAVRAARRGGAQVRLVGDVSRVEAELARLGGARATVTLVPAGSRVDMDEAPAVVLRDKADASVRVACELVARGEAGAVVSAGHTGALMVAAKHVLGTLDGIDRPAIATPLPHRRGQSLLLDSGANVDCKPHYLLQFALMGQAYARAVWGKEAPRVALLSNGGEAGKGNELTRQAYRLLAERVPHFAGNLEARDLFRGRAEVIVCDGFVGNLVLKTAEAAGAQLRLLVKDRTERSLLGRLGGWLLRPLLAELARRTDHQQVGGSLLLGVRGVAVVAHGASGARALENALALAARCVESRLTDALAEGIAAAGNPAAPAEGRPGGTDPSAPPEADPAATDTASA